MVGQEASGSVHSKEGSSCASACTTMSSKIAKSQKKRSIAWDYFEEIYVDGVRHGKCKLCFRVYAAHPVVNGTTNMLNHIPLCPENPHKVDSKQARLSLQPNRESSDKPALIVVWKFNQDATRKALTKMIIMDELPFKFVENEGFKQFMDIACPNFRISSRRTLVHDVFELYEIEFGSLKKMFKNSCQRVCLTTNTWTSIQRINYMCVTAHVIDENWNMHKRKINFCPILGHKGLNIGSTIEKCVRFWEIEDKVFTITVHNASSNDSAMIFFKEKMSNWDNSILKGEYVHIRCVAHILNLVVNDGLKLMNESIEKVRFAVRYIRQSPARLNKFKDYVEVEKIECAKSLCLDVLTRWNSTYLMLDVAQQYERAFDRYDEQEPCFRPDMLVAKMVDKLDENNQIILGLHGKVVKERRIVDMRPTSEDWTTCRKFPKLLENFYKLTLKISGSLYITSNRIAHDLYDINELLEEWRVSNDLEIKKMGVSMKQKFDKYWGDPVKMNSLIYVALVLDPRYKLKYTNFLLKKMYGELKGEDVGTKLINALHSLYNDYKSKKEPQVDGNSQGQSSSDMSIDEPSREKEKRKKSLMDEFMKLKALEGCIGDSSSSDLDKYLREEIEPDTNTFDILIWWKLNAPRFPIFSSIACDVLAIPMSTVVSESTFSTGGRILDSFRNSLTPKIVEALICTQDWIRSTRTIIDLDDSIEDLEKFEKAAEIAEILLLLKVKLLKFCSY